MRKPVTAKLIGAFVLVQSLFLLNSKFQESITFLWLHRPICVAPKTGFGYDPTCSGRNGSALYAKNFFFVFAIKHPLS